MKKMLIITVVLLLSAGHMFAQGSSLVPAFRVFPGSAYDNEQARQYSNAAGSVSAVQGKKGENVIFSLSASGLTPGKVYLVFFDSSGITAGDASTAGPWARIGAFAADENGNASWSYNLPVDGIRAGAHAYAIQINRSEWAKTVLISSGVSFTVR